MEERGITFGPFIYGDEQYDEQFFHMLSEAWKGRCEFPGSELLLLLAFGFGVSGRRASFIED